MSVLDGDTIAAIATPPGRGGIGVVRISGATAEQVGSKVCSALPAPRRVGLAQVGSDEGRIRVIAFMVE